MYKLLDTNNHTVFFQPENLLFRERSEDSDLLIADFGLSRIIDTDKFHTLKTTCGTPGYMVGNNESFLICEKC